MTTSPLYGGESKRYNERKKSSRVLGGKLTAEGTRGFIVPKKTERGCFFVSLIKIGRYFLLTQTSISHSSRLANVQ